jgi:hypothetical protein
MLKPPTPAPVVPEVQVVVDPSKPAGQQCAPDTAPAAKGHVPTTFVFNLVNGWQWQGNSPVVVQSGGTQFPFPSHVSNDPRTAGAAILHDNNTDTRKYKYEITVSNSITGEKKLIDPYIENQ